MGALNQIKIQSKEGNPLRDSIDNKKIIIIRCITYPISSVNFEAKCW